MDRFTEKTGAVATVFSQGSDFLRVATTVKRKTANGPSARSSTKDHPALAALAAGKPYVGLAKLFGKSTTPATRLSSPGAR